MIQVSQNSKLLQIIIMKTRELFGLKTITNLFVTILGDSYTNSKTND